MTSYEELNSLIMPASSGSGSSQTGVLDYPRVSGVLLDPRNEYQYAHLENHTADCCKTPSKSMLTVTCIFISCLSLATSTYLLFDRILQDDLHRMGRFVNVSEQNNKTSDGITEPQRQVAHPNLNGIAAAHCLNWGSSSMKHCSRSYLKGIEFINNRLVIQNGGLYYVYSQVFFRFEISNGHKLPEFLHHQMCRFNSDLPEGGNQILIQAYHTCPKDPSNDVYVYTSYVGGVFNLATHDELYVKVSDESFVLDRINVSFVGAFFLGT